MNHVFIYRSQDLYDENHDNIILDKIEQNYSSYIMIIPEQNPPTSYSYFLTTEEGDKYIIV